MDDLYGDAETVMNRLHNEYLQRGSRDFRSLTSALSSTFGDATHLDRLGRTLAELGWVEYKRESGHGFVRITDNGIEMMQKHGSIGNYFRFEVSRSATAANSSIPTTNPSIPTSQKIIRTSSGVIVKVLRFILTTIISTLVSIRVSIPSTIFDHLVIERTIEFFQKSKSVAPTKKATELIPDIHTQNKVNKEDTLGSNVLKKKFLHPK